MSLMRLYHSKVGRCTLYRMPHRDAGSVETEMGLFGMLRNQTTGPVQIGRAQLFGVPEALKARYGDDILILLLDVLADRLLWRVLFSR